MVALNLVGIILIILGMAAGIALYINAINDKIRHTSSLVSLFCCSLSGGSYLCKIGAGTNDGFIYVSYYLFCLGVVCAVTLFLTEIGFIQVKSKSAMWVFFLFCVPLGAMGIYSL
jgi:hypothetical protein